MKKLLDWQTKEVANIYDEVTLWSAPFGRLLLENIPMKPNATVVDIGFGTGFPLIELAQRFGESSKIYGIDIWQEGINRAKEKIGTLEINNIEIIEESATDIPIGDGEVDLVTSNLGVNNFEEKEFVYPEIHRILKKGGAFALTTNPIGTFEELFEIFASILEELKHDDGLVKLDAHIEHRNTKEGLVAEIEDHGFELVNSVEDTTNLRFVDSRALLDHSLIRVGFRATWENLVNEKNRDRFLERVIHEIEMLIEENGEFKMTVPMLYLEFRAG